MGPAFWADVVLFVHFAYTAGVVLPVLIVLVGWRRGWRLAHADWFRTTNLILVAPVISEIVLSERCPLTMLGNHLRALAGENPYAGGCVAYWLNRLMGQWFPPWVAAAFAGLFALGVPILYIALPPRWLEHRRAARRHRHA